MSRGKEWLQMNFYSTCYESKQFPETCYNSNIYHMLWLFSHSVMPTLLWPCRLQPSSSLVHRTFQARILEWVAISFSRASSWPRDQTQISFIGRWILYYWFTWEAHLTVLGCLWLDVFPKLITAIIVVFHEHRWLDCEFQKHCQWT